MYYRILFHWTKTRQKQKQNKTEVVLRLSLNMIGNSNDETNICHY